MIEFPRIVALSAGRVGMTSDGFPRFDPPIADYRQKSFGDEVIRNRSGLRVTCVDGAARGFECAVGRRRNPIGYPCCFCFIHKLLDASHRAGLIADGVDARNQVTRSLILSRLGKHLLDFANLSWLGVSCFRLAEQNLRIAEQTIIHRLACGGEILLGGRRESNILCDIRRDRFELCQVLFCEL